MNKTKTPGRVDHCFCNNGLFDNDITAMKKTLQSTFHLQQFEIKSIIQSAYTHDDKICVLVDWAGDYEPSWELLQNMKNNVRNWEKHNNVNECAAFILPYDEPEIHAPVNPGLVKNKSDRPYLLNSSDMQYMYNRMNPPQYYNSFDNRN